MYFHTDDPAMIEFVCRVAERAAYHGQSLRVDVDDKGQLRIKRGDGMWTAPFASTPDPWRDQS